MTSPHGGAPGRLAFSSAVGQPPAAVTPRRSPAWVDDVRRHIAERTTPPDWVDGVRRHIAEGEQARAIARANAPVDVEYRPHRRADFELSLTPGARDGIRRELAAVYRDFGHRRVETGGLLLAHQRPRNGWCEIVYATPPADGSRHAAHEVILGSAQAMLDELPDFLGHLAPVGCWHSHSDSDREGNPSPRDRESWARVARATRTPYVSIIVVADPDRDHGWMTPAFSAWVTHDDGRRLACDRIGRVT
jgi:hypothetical protein